MIPKIIHYCWFGQSEMPELSKKCIESWKKYLPDYQIKMWNEDNFKLDMFPYTREAYESQKFAFVTDVVRLYALYTEGGIYMDTDVEVLQSLDKFLFHVAFSGFEDDKNVSTGIMASEKRGKWVKDNLENYKARHFIKEDGSFDLTTNVSCITSYMLRHGFLQNGKYQDFPNLITIYPKEFFSPKSGFDGEIYLTSNTYTIHHFSGSWLTREHLYELEVEKHLSFIPHRLKLYMAKFLSLYKYHGLEYAIKEIMKWTTKKLFKFV